MSDLRQGGGLALIRFTDVIRFTGLMNDDSPEARWLFFRRRQVVDGCWPIV